MPSHTGRLVLTTADPQAAPESDLVRGALAGVGFIGAPRHGDLGTYEAGPGLLGLLSFTGCAVVLPKARAAETACHVRLLGPEPIPRLVWGRNTRGPRCPGCRARLQDWSAHLAGWQERPALGQRCPTCGGARPPWRWDWKQDGGFGRLFILVEEVFPGEAVPTEPLLNLLAGVSGSGWRHFYVQD